MVRKIYIYPAEEVKKMNPGGKIAPTVDSEESFARGQKDPKTEV